MIRCREIYLDTRGIKQKENYFRSSTVMSSKMFMILKLYWGSYMKGGEMDGIGVRGEVKYPYKTLSETLKEKFT
jgi:hypothetical protein